MAGTRAALGLTLDHRYHVTWITPAAARMSGAYVGMRAGSDEHLPWAITRRYLEAVERCLDCGLAVAWYEPGDDEDFPAACNQVFPLPFKRGIFASFSPIPHKLPSGY